MAFSFAITLCSIEDLKEQNLFEIKCFVTYMFLLSHLSINVSLLNKSVTVLSWILIDLLTFEW